MFDAGLCDCAPQIDQCDRHSRPDEPGQEDSLGALERVGGAGEPVGVYLSRVGERCALRLPCLLVAEVLRPLQEACLAYGLGGSLGDRGVECLEAGLIARRLQVAVKRDGCGVLVCCEL